MAAIESKASGDWSDGSTWDSDPAIPANGDSVTILNTHTVTLDADLITGAIDLAGLTIDVGGTLLCSTATGTYSIQCSADITVNGTFQAGTSTSVPLPSDVSLTIDFDSTASSIEGNSTGTLSLFCGEPTNKWVRLSGAEAAAQTILSVDTDLTSDTLWADGAEIAIIDSYSDDSAEDVERRTIAAGGIAADTITVTAGLTDNKLEGAYIVLLDRNIKITGSTTYAVEDCDSCDCYAFIDSASGLYSCTTANIGGSMYLTAGYGARSCTTVYFDCAAVDDGLASDYCLYLVDNLTTASDAFIGGFYANNQVTNGVYDGVCAGMYFAMSSANAIAMNGLMWGNRYGFNLSQNIYIYGDILDCDRSCIFDSSGIVAANCEIEGDYCLETSHTGKFYNVLFDATVSENLGYNSIDISGFDYIESFDHDQTENAFKAWSRGGYVTSQTASPPTGYDIWYELTAEDDTETYPVFRQYETVVLPGTAIEVDGLIRNADNGDLTGCGIALQIIDKFADPLVDSTQDPLDEDEIPEPDSGTEAGWQDVSVIWANQGDTPRQVIVRMIAYHDGGVDDVTVDIVWSIADYQDQIQSIYDMLPVDATYLMGSDDDDAHDTQLDTIEADTNELQGDWTNGGRLDLIIDAILADTNELQTDWTNGGRLDLIIDAILEDTNEIQGKLPDDYIMGSSVTTSMDDEINAIVSELGQTNVIESTLPGGTGGETGAGIAEGC